jgi:anti-sigma factor RsiW
LSKLTRLTAEQRADLVAYLDGELDEGATQRIEGILAQSPVARNDTEMLVRTYDLLELLPRPKATTEFTEKTIATARLTEVKTDFAQSPALKTARDGLKLLVLAAVVFAVGVGGYAIANRLVSLESDQLVRDLPVVERMDDYREVGDFEFVKKLSNESSLLRDIKAEVSRGRK